MRVFLALSWLLASLFFTGAFSWAAESDVDRLLDLLVEKKVLSADDATGFKADLAVKKQEEKQPVATPDWVANIKLKGDVRVRHEWDKNKGLQDNSRERIRTRLGLEGKANNKFKAGIGIATGLTSDPRSRDVTFGNSSTANTPGAGKDIILDYAYGQFTPFSGLTLTAGKFQNNIWQPHDVFWKPDITPEGLSISLTRDFNSKLSWFVNELYFVLKNDARTDRQPFVNALQPGLNYAVNDQVNLKSAFAFYKFQYVTGSQKYSYSKSGASGYTSSGNTISGGTYKYNYDSIHPSLELSVKNPLGGIVPFASLFGDYVYNIAHVHSNTGRGAYDIGLKFGSEKVSDWAQWQAKFAYEKLGRDSWLDIFTNNSRYGGVTNSKTVETAYEFGLGKNTSLLLRYYVSQSLTKTSGARYAPEQVLQADWNLKF